LGEGGLAGPSCRDPSQADSATTGSARAILGELEARRGMIDNDLRLHALTFAVRLDELMIARHSQRMLAGD